MPDRLLVLGLGNPLCQDDGVGVVAVTRLLEAWSPGPGVKMMEGGTLGLWLLPLLESYRNGLLVDAIRADGEPGTLVHGEPLTGGLFDPKIFGPLDGSQPRWGRLVVDGVQLAGVTITSVPVPPIADRMPSMPDPAMRVPWHGPINDAWIALVEASDRHDRLVASKAPRNLLAHAAAHLRVGTGT